ncbi:uncharacterized protein Z518_01594 [Rhinocladiella mackenziei CBS 650.93]|uniref:Uncharacterized protein n=1 Tax=Rhinocladiella mackenziei CBS 650.93 TaxID=1442369 RepID=A0A0D2J4C1_9EURO|nr:uncharacterized protein Z518_01594 [Rhinocladiella mackenziei CBS 650.93]KIX10511.1 hypothetical protein Z518_01594 [Rhinocladiella mackenziei CBS 650.93]
MVPRSPTHAFDPTPALEHNPVNYSPLNYFRTTGASQDPSSSILRGVRSSDPPSYPPLQGRHSIATTNVSLLPPVPSASQLPKQGFQMTNPTPDVDITAYMEQCRLWNTQLRESHESERKAWNIERTALKARIVELEQKLKKSRDPKRRSSNDSSSASLHSFRSDFQPFVPLRNNVPPRTRIGSEPAISTPPVWKGPESTPPVTRVFSHDDDVSHLPSISEDEALPPLSKEVSSISGEQEKIENVPVPIEQVDKTLDGITLKSAALTSSFDTIITSPHFASPTLSPEPRPKQPMDGLLQVDVNSLLSPLDEKLKRHAGHTPMAFDGTLSTGSESTGPMTPMQEKPRAPAPTKRPPLRPSENSDSYFNFTSATDNLEDLAKKTMSAEREPEQEPIHEPENDSALKGPLTLDFSARTEAASVFLEKLDAKLSEEAAHRSREDSSMSDGGEEKSNGVPEKPSDQEPDDDMPRLRIKNSMNFGSAWGGDQPGRI